jgi:general secretion pathway protein C
MAMISTRGLSTKPLPSVVLLFGYLLAFCLLAGCLAYWGMQLFAPPAPIASSGVVAEKTASLDLTGAGRLFGAAASTQTQTAAVAAPPINVKIVGLMAAYQSARASAVLSIENRPAQAFAIGDYLGNNTKLVDITRAGIVIEQNGNRTKVESPAVPTIASLSKPTPPPGAKPDDPSQAKSSIPLPAGSSSPPGSTPSIPFTPPPIAQPTPPVPNNQPNNQPITPPQMQPAAGIQGTPSNPNDGNSQPSMPTGGGAFGRPK